VAVVWEGGGMVAAVTVPVEVVGEMAAAREAAARALQTLRRRQLGPFFL